MKFIYIGDNKHPPQKIKFMGKYEFNLNGEAVDIDARTAEKLKGNRCFKEVDYQAKKSK